MISERILDILRDNSILEESDVPLLDKSIEMYPFVQSIRAVKLLGTHQFNASEYQGELSKTAAYTTDKKTLYHFINNPSHVSSTGEESSNLEDLSLENNNAVESQDAYSTKDSFLAGTETEIVETATQSAEETVNVENEIDSFSTTDESNVTVAEVGQNTVDQATKVEVSGVSNSSEKESKQEADINFHGVDNFLPTVNLKPNTQMNTYVPQAPKNRHEEEMQKLIAEVEAKIKANKEKQEGQGKQEQANDNKEDTTGNHEISFSESSRIIEVEKERQDPKSEVQNRKWAPKQFLEEVVSKERQSEEKEEIKEKRDNMGPKVTRSPFASVSFFTTASKLDGYAPRTNNQEPSEPKEVEVKEEKESAAEQSNVPSFINTWHNWLKVDRSHVKSISTIVENEEAEEKKEIEREKAIEKFIETEPKISKLKEENSFTIKEKTDDISHLMTDTLAGIYLEQRLYTKATAAYQVLMEKYPEKIDFYKEKLEEIQRIKFPK